jgi:hypothetical protein
LIIKRIILPEIGHDRRLKLKTKKHITSKRLTGLKSSLGTISIRKSNMSDLEIATEMSDFCRVRLLFSSVLIQARKVNSKTKTSHAFANRIGAYM